MKIKLSVLISLFLAFIIMFLPGCRTREKTPEEPAYIYSQYYWYTEEEEVLRNTQYIVVGTVGKSAPDEFKDEYGDTTWRTITDFHVEEVLYGSVEPDSDIQLITMGAKGKEIVDMVEARGSFMEDGEKLLLFLYVKTNSPGGRYDGMGIPVSFCGERTVDVDGNLGYRYDPFEKIYTRGDPPFYQYKTVEQLRAALPEWLEATAEWKAQHPPYDPSKVPPPEPDSLEEIYSNSFLPPPSIRGNIHLRPPHVRPGRKNNFQT